MNANSRDFGLTVLAWAMVASALAIVTLACDAVLHHVKVWGR